MRTHALPLRGPSEPGSLPQNERQLREAFLEQVDRIPGGERLNRCIQCGTCSGSCPVTYAMDYSPRQVIAMFRAGAVEPLLDSRTIWICASCYQCTARCPSDIKITDLLYALKRLALRQKIVPRNWPVYALSEVFTEMVRRHGRNYETGLLLRFYLRSEPRRLITGLGDAWALWSHGRLPLRPRRVRDLAGLRKIIARAETFDRPQEAGERPSTGDAVGYGAIGMTSQETVH